MRFPCLDALAAQGPFERPQVAGLLVQQHNE
jgi:hypothetical protein